MSQQPSGIMCTPDELAFSFANPTALHCLTRGDTLGLLITTETSLLSLVALGYVYSIILLNTILLYLSPAKRRKGLRLFRQPMDLLMLSLFVADTLQAIGGAVNAKWVKMGKVEVGTFCEAQSIIQNVGETGVALSNLTISVYTFCSLWLRKDISSKRLTLGVITSIWLFIAILVAVSNATHRDPPFSTPTPYWCWISKPYFVWGIIAEYLWLWLALFLSLLVYVPLLWMRNISRDRFRQAFVFLAYPLTYCFCILPLSVTRWIGYMQEAKYDRNDVPSGVTFFAVSIFGLSGFLNVILLLSTRPNSGLFGNLVFESPRRPPSPILAETEPQADQYQANQHQADHFQADQFQANAQRTTERSEEFPEDIGRLP